MPRKCRNWRIAPLMVPIAALIGGCVGDRPSYPDDYPPLAAVEPGECPDISGQYSNVLLDPGSAFDSWYGKEDRPYYEADRVVVTQPDPRTIEFVVLLEGGRSVRHSLRRDDNGFSCSNGMVFIASAMEFVSDALEGHLGAGGVWKEWRIARTVEGSLAVEHVSKRADLFFFFFPMGFAESFWLLIPVASEAPDEPPSLSP